MSVPDHSQEKAIDEFLEGGTRADQWREMREMLQVRLKDAIAARDAAIADGNPRPALEKKVAELRLQVTALAEEEAVTQFVEDSVRASLGKTPRQSFEDDDEEGYY